MLFRPATISLAVSLLSLLICHPLQAADKYQQAAAESVKSYLAEHPRAAVTVGILDTKGSHVFGFGLLNKDNPKSKPNGKTIYQIGSITKVFTTTMLAEQVVLGHMKLSDPAQKYLPAIKLPREENRQITLLDLATHHSGLPRLPQMLWFFLAGTGDGEDPYALLEWKNIRQMMPDVWLKYSIGTKYNYSNLAMGLLGQTIVNVTKSANYAALVAQQIAKPLGLADTCITLDPNQLKRLAPAHLGSGKRTVAWKFGSLEGCGALYSTVNDLLIFAAANLGLQPTPLAKAMQLAQKPYSEPTWTDKPMGLGWHLMKYHGQSLVWHNGMTGGYSSMLILLPKEKMAVAMLSNHAAAIDPCAYHLIDLLFPQK